MDQKYYGIFFIRAPTLRAGLIRKAYNIKLDLIQEALPMPALRAARLTELCDQYFELLTPAVSSEISNCLNQSKWSP